MSDLNTTFVNGSAGNTPIDADYLNAVNKRLRSRLPVLDVVEDFGAKVDGTTDDTAAWQAAVNAAATAGGGRIICSKSGVSIIAGALQDTGGANAQIVLPSIDYVDTENVSIEIVGPYPPANVFSVIGSTPLPDGGLVLKSTLTAGSGGAMIGAKGPAGTAAEFTNLTLRLENLTFRMPANPTHTALDLRRVATLDVDSVFIDAGSYDVGAVAQQTTATSFGLRCPAHNNGAHVRLGQVDVVGFYNGYEFAEHSSGQYVGAGACRVAYTFLDTYHASKFQRLVAHHCQRVIKFTGTHYVDVDQLNIEHAASGTWAPVWDVDDASNLGHGTLWWHVVLAGSGISATFLKNGGSGFNTYRVGTAMPAGGAGTTIYVARDRLIAATGNTILTLGATPVANSPQVWVNSVIKWPSADYSISGNVITFASPLAASDVVAVYYTTTNSAAGASTLSSAAASGVADNFNRADSSTSLGSTSTGGVAWSALRGTWGIQSNRARVYTQHASTLNFAVVEGGLANCTVQMTLGSQSAAYAQCGLYLRATDANNAYLLESGDGSGGPSKLYKWVGGAATVIASSANGIQFLVGDVITAVLAGTSITVKRNGATIITATDSTFTTQTKHGLYAISDGTSGANLDDFSIAP